MKNIRAYGIKFQKSNDSGIAKITVLNTTDGLYIDHDGTTSSTAVSRLVDLYQSNSTYATVEKDFCYWVTLEVDKNYEITCEISGTKNTLSSDYYMRISGYLSKELSIDGSITKTLQVWDTSDTSIKQNFTLTENTTTDLEKLAYYNGDGTTTLFTLSTSVLADTPTRFSKNGGSTWMTTYDTSLTWGSNSPLYDDEIVLAGNFSVNFEEAPIVGASNVIIAYVPKINTYKMILQTNQATSEDTSYIDYQGNIRLLDYAIEMIR